MQLCSAEVSVFSTHVRAVTLRTLLTSVTVHMNETRARHIYFSRAAISVQRRTSKQGHSSRYCLNDLQSHLVVPPYARKPRHPAKRQLHERAPMAARLSDAHLPMILLQKSQSRHLREEWRRQMGQVLRHTYRGDARSYNRTADKTPALPFGK